MVEHSEKNNRKIKQQGITLIELLVVLAIIAIIGIAVVPKVIDRPNEARVVKAKQDISAFEGAVSLYRLDNFKYPDTGQGLQALQGKYLERVPKDPWGNDYQYLYPGTNGTYDIFSYGEDGTPGGDGFNADIGNWQ